MPSHGLSPDITYHLKSQSFEGLTWAYRDFLEGAWLFFTAGTSLVVITRMLKFYTCGTLHRGSHLFPCHPTDFPKRKRLQNRKVEVIIPWRSLRCHTVPSVTFRWSHKLALTMGADHIEAQVQIHLSIVPRYPHWSDSRVLILLR